MWVEFCANPTAQTIPLTGRQLQFLAERGIGQCRCRDSQCSPSLVNRGRVERYLRLGTVDVQTPAFMRLR